ncbi:toxin-antitoxin system YwqK family antitoxin [Geofilum rubicundum]|uniref:Uncharacterized protein n=1 Tax=Geofilum rubicundum JCM 15548 TaxID=1236989 RepID=A0A0E9LQT7_9BACT|nr:hypothetical protein [Geofilum rubicundum]GAO27663.1 hypothetical protein JCM15548_14504 [Geofilum rubicundum JCM 15548]
MIYYKFVILLISTALASCQGKTTFTIEETSENSLRINSKTNSLSLEFKNGSISSIHAINHDSKNGNSWEYYPDGSIKNKYSYRNGTIVNSAYEYYNNGSLSVYKFFDTMGRLAYLRNYAEDGSFDSESGVLITYNEDEIMLKNDTLTLPIQMPEPPGTKISSVIIFEDSSLNPIDSIRFEASNFDVKIPVKEISNLLIKTQLREREVFTCNDKRFSISNLVDLCSRF